jgi:hypothetical protein
LYRYAVAVTQLISARTMNSGSGPARLVNLGHALTYVAWRYDSA